jgi:hypothetical protein
MSRLQAIQLFVSIAHSGVALGAGESFDVALSDAQSGQILAQQTLDISDGNLNNVLLEVPIDTTLANFETGLAIMGNVGAVYTAGGAPVAAACSFLVIASGVAMSSIVDAVE